MKIRRYPLQTAYDMHVHLRRGEMLAKVAPVTARLFRAAIVMPNTDPPILNIHDAAQYKREILAVCKDFPDFDPLMTIKLTPKTEIKDIAAAKITGIMAGKFYPEGVTTNSQNGFQKLSDAKHLLEAMQDYDLPLSVHAEMPGIDPMLAEQMFLEEIIGAAMSFPKLRIIVEHLSTLSAVDLVKELPGTVAGTITAHHLVLTSEDALNDPHAYCKPMAKTNIDRQALIAAAVSGNPKFFFGSDSAPHPRQKKTCDKPAAGCFTAPLALNILAQVFAEAHAIQRLDDFLGKFGPEFYGLKPEAKCLELTPHPGRYSDTNADPLPFFAYKIISWQVERCSPQSPSGCRC
ncbi:MAG: dihydroorotase [Patescibacteria group bacterium]